MAVEIPEDRQPEEKKEAAEGGEKTKEPGADVADEIRDKAKGFFKAPPPPNFENVKNEEKTWGLIAHLASFISIIGIPFGNLLGPLIVWLVKKDESAFVAHHAKESLNFQISITLYGMGLSIVMMLLVVAPMLFSPTLGFVILIPFLLLFLAIFVFVVVVVVRGAISANRGEGYSYPVSLRLLK